MLSDAYFPVRFRAQQRPKYNSLQLTANCIAPIRYLRLYIKVIKNLQPQRTQKFPLSLTLLSFKTRIELPPVLTTTANFPSVHFQLLEYSRQSPSFSAHRATLMTKLSLFFQHFLHVLQISQFNSAFAVSFHSTRTALESSLTMAWFSWINQNSCATHSNQWDCFICVDNRLLQMAPRVCQSGRSAGQRRLSSHIERFFCGSLFRYYIKQIVYMLPCVCSVTDHRGRQNVVRTSVTQSAIASCATFFSYHILTSSVIYYWTDARQHGIYLLNITLHHFISYHSIA